MNNNDPTTFHKSYYRKNVEKQFAWACPTIHHKDNDPDYTVFYTVVNMIDYCERSIQRFKNCPPRMELIIREVQY